MENKHGTLIVIGMVSAVIYLILMTIIFMACMIGAIYSNQEPKQPTMEGSQVCLQLKLKNVEPGSVGINAEEYNG